MTSSFLPQCCCSPRTFLSYCDLCGTFFIYTEALSLHTSCTYYQTQQYVGVFVYTIDVTVSLYRYFVDGAVCIRVSEYVGGWVDGLMPSIRVLLQLKIAISIRVW